MWLHKTGMLKPWHDLILVARHYDFRSYMLSTAILVCFNLFLLFGFAQKLPQEGGQGGWKKLFFSCLSYPAAKPFRKSGG